MENREKERDSLWRNEMGESAGTGTGQIKKKGSSSTLTGDQGESWGRQNSADVEELLPGSFCEIEGKLICLEREDVME